jgi:hypothetical protein
MHPQAECLDAAHLVLSGVSAAVEEDGLLERLVPWRRTPREHHAAMLRRIDRLRACCRRAKRSSCTGAASLPAPGAWRAVIRSPVCPTDAASSITGWVFALNTLAGLTSSHCCSRISIDSAGVG